MRILAMGDSIMQYNDCTTYPLTGWIQGLVRFFPPETEFHNYARNGRSTKSFIDEGRFDVVRTEACSGDFVLIGFGHNDEKAEDPTRYTAPDADGLFRKNLAYFVTELRAVGALPILLTPVVRRKFGADGKIENTHGDYPAAVIETAAALKVPCINLTALSAALVEKMGAEDSKRLFMNFGAGLYDNYSAGKEDNSHLRPDGAYAVSRLAATEISRLSADWPDYAPLAHAALVLTVDRDALEREVQDEKLMA